MSGFTSVLIVGASGNIGNNITNGFLQATPAWKVSLLVSPTTLQDAKKKQAYDEFTSKGAQLITGEVDKPETYQDKIKGIDVVVSAISGRAIKSQIPLIHAVKHAGTKLFLPSEYGFDATHVPPTKSFQPKVEIFNEIKKVGVPYMLIATGLFYEYLLLPRFNTDVANKQVALYGERSTKISACAVTEFGALLPYVVNDPTLINKSVCLSGDQTTTGHMSDEFASLVNGPVKVVQTKPQEILEQINSKSGPEYDHSVARILDEILYTLSTGESFFPGAIDGSKYGKKLSTIHEFVQKQKKN